MAKIIRSGKDKRIRVRTLNACICIAGAVLLIGLLAATHIVSEEYALFATSTDDYMRLEMQADIVKEASDYLTEQVRMFAYTTDIQYAHLYFEETNVAQRRENALAVLASYPWSDTWDTQVTEAVQTSTALMEQEIYAMKLVAVAKGYGADVLPAEVWAVQLDPRDVGLSPDDMLEKARGILFGTQYLLTKNEIYDKLSIFTDGMLLEAESSIAVGMDKLADAITILKVLIVVCVALLAVNFSAMAVLVVNPLHRYSRNIDIDTMLEPASTYEINRIAQAYNVLYEKNGSGAVDTGRDSEC